MSHCRLLIILTFICVAAALPVVYFTLAWNIREPLRFHFVPVLGLHNLPSYEVRVENVSAFPVSLHQVVWIQNRGVVSQYSATSLPGKPAALKVQPQRCELLCKPGSSGRCALGIAVRLGCAWTAHLPGCDGMAASASSRGLATPCLVSGQ